jgi:hypothetical protein
VNGRGQRDLNRHDAETPRKSCRLSAFSCQPVGGSSQVPGTGAGRACGGGSRGCRSQTRTVGDVVGMAFEFDEFIAGQRLV